VTLAPGKVPDALAAAIASRHVAASRVGIGADRFLSVVDGAAVVDEMANFFAEIAAGNVPLPPNWSVESRSPESLRRRVARRYGWRRGVRRIAWRYFGRTPERLFLFTRLGPFFPLQNAPEISNLLKLVAERRPSSILEIGTARGGTAFLLSRYTPRRSLVVTCDLRITASARALPGLARRGQDICVLELDSHSEDGAQRVRQAVPEGVDLLFIDGDHSYDGVRQDFITYADLVRPGGMIVLHDIVEDYRTRHGIDTAAWVGGVPRFWRELVDALPPEFIHHELVQDWHQDGLGIGVIVCDADPEPGQRLIARLQNAAGAPPNVGACP
jgi:predicted O-methyltransferase YrrM